LERTTVDYHFSGAGKEDEERKHRRDSRDNGEGYDYDQASIAVSAASGLLVCGNGCPL
jgi:hypothetical protein